MASPKSTPHQSMSLQSMPESELLQLLTRGDRAAAEALVERTYQQTWAALVRLTGDPDLAADLTQETYRKAWTSLDRFDRRSRLATWLYRIAYNVFLNHIRRPQPVTPLQDLSGDERPLHDPPDPGLGIDDVLARREVSRRLRRAVVALPDPLRFTVTARFWGELSIEDIASLDEISGTAVRKRLKKAFSHLRLSMEDAS